MGKRKIMGESGSPYRPPPPSMANSVPWHTINQEGGRGSHPQSRDPFSPARSKAKMPHDVDMEAPIHSIKRL
jgi:hypothetical protein